MAKFGTHIQEAYDELAHKVTWPTWSSLQQTTVIVIVSLFLISLLLLGMDALSENVFKVVYDALA